MKLALADNKEFIKGITELILANLENEKFGVDELAQLSGMSRFSLNRKLHSITKIYASRFIREIRLHKALEMLQNGTVTASEVAYKLGFSSPGYFNKCFHEYFGYAPGKVKQIDFENQEAELQPDIMEKQVPNKPVGPASKSNLSRMLIFLGAISLIALVVVQKIRTNSNQDKLISPDGRISVAIMPFQNMTNDTLWNVWQDGIQTNLTTSLSNVRELKVRQIETVNRLLYSKGITDYASIDLSVARSISRKLAANVFVNGIINKAGSTVRLNAQLINSGTEEDIKSFQIDGTSEDIIRMIDSLSVMIRNSLLIYNLEKVEPAEIHERYLSTVHSPDAYRYFIYGNLAFYRSDFSTAIDWFKHSLALDSNLVGAMGKISVAYYNENYYEQGKEWCRKFYGKMDQMSIQDKIAANALYALFFKTLNERVTCLRQMIDFDDQNPMTYFNIGDCYLEMYEYERAIPEFEKALEIFQKWDSKPFWVAFYSELGICYHKTGQFRKEKRLYKKADRDFPGDPGMMDQHAWLALSSGDTVSADQYIKKWISIRKEQSWSEARISSYMAYIYSMASMPDKEEEFHRKALSLEPGNTGRMNLLAYFLIDKERNIEEGVELCGKALKLNPENFNSMFIKGWGLLKQGKYPESLELLQKSWDLRVQKSIYKHKPFLVLEEAKKAVGSI